MPKQTYELPWDRMFSYECMLTPFRIDTVDYRSGVRMAYAYIFGIRIAAWNKAP